jgi:hypothetical protein
MTSTFKPTAHPEIVVAAASAIWGLLWIPLRAFDSQGMAPGWVILCQFVAPLALMIPFVVLDYSNRFT